MLEEKDINQELLNYSSDSTYLFTGGVNSLKEFDKVMKEEWDKLNAKEEPKPLKDPRKQKIRELKTQIKLEESTITELLKDSTKIVEEEFRNDLAKRKALISSMKAELVTTRNNKYSSSFYSFTPNINMNRRQARNFRKLGHV